jgi:peroxiredoxin
LRSSHVFVLGVLLVVLGCAHAEPPLTAYSLALEDTRGAHISLEAYRGQVILLNFFATWCFFDVPMYRAAQAKYGPQGLQVIGVGLDLEGALVLEPFRQFNQLGYPVLLGGGKFAEPGLPFAPVTVCPTTYVIDREGRIIQHWMGSLDQATFDKVIQEALR